MTPEQEAKCQQYIRSTTRLERLRDFGIVGFTARRADALYDSGDRALAESLVYGALPRWLKQVVDDEGWYR